MVKITSDISVTDIPNLQRNDYSIYREKIAPIISSSEYKRWIFTGGVHAVLARNNKDIIGQMWAHPLKIYQNNELLRKRFFWIHNIKIHPTWQNKGIFRQIVKYYHKNIFSEEDHRLYLVEYNNTKMRLLARKLKLFPITKVFGIILLRYFAPPKILRPATLEIIKSNIVPKFWINNVEQHKKYWIPHFSWDKSPEWISIYFRNRLICIFQITRPIHPTQGRFIKKFPLILQTLQVRYFSIPSDVVKVHPSITRSIFTTLFHTYPQINALIFTLNPIFFSKKLSLPRLFFLTREFILYSTTKEPELVKNNLDFHSTFTLLNR